MLVIKVELHSAITGKVTEIGRATITNNGLSATPGTCKYDARIEQATNNLTNPEWGIFRKDTHVYNWDRRKSVWKLIAAVLQAADLVECRCGCGESAEYCRECR